MAAANAFVNGFMGGMGAMTQMMDAKARREHYAWQKEMTMQDREIAAQERAYVDSERQRAKDLRQTTALLHYHQNATPEIKKSMNKVYADAVNSDPRFASLLDNNNPNERAQFREWMPVIQKGKQVGWTPGMDVYDVTGDEPKFVRQGNMSENREKGGRDIYLTNEDLVDLISSPAMADQRLAMEMEVLRQGGTLPEAKESFGEKYVYEGNILQDSSTGQTRRLGYVGGSKNGGSKNGGSKNGGKSGSGSGGTWKNYQTREIPDPAFPDDPSKVLTEMVQYKDNGDGTVSVRGMVDTGGGKMKVEEYGVSYFNQPGNTQPASGMNAMFGDQSGGGAQLREEDVGNPPREKTAKDEEKTKSEETTAPPVAEVVAAPLPIDPVAMGGRGAYGVIAGDAAERARQRHEAQVRLLQLLEELKKNKPIRGRSTNYAAGMSAFRPGGMQ